MGNRETALAELREYVGQATRGPGLILADQVTAAARNLEQVTDPQQDYDAAHVLGWYHYLRFSALPEGRDGDDLALAFWYLAPIARITPQAVPAPFRPDPGSASPDTDVPVPSRAAAVIMSDRAGDLVGLYEQTRQETLLDQAVALARTALTGFPGPGIHRTATLTNLMAALLRQFEGTGRIELLDEAIETGRDAVATRPADDPRAVTTLVQLGAVLQTRYQHTGQIEALEEAVQVGRAALAESSEDYHDRAVILGNLTNALRLLFERTGRIEALEEAVRTGQGAVAVSDGRGDRVMWLSNLGSALHTLFQHTGRIDALEEAVEIGRQAIAAAPVEHHYRAVMSEQLLGALLTLFDRTGRTELLAEAVQAGREAVAAARGNARYRGTALHNLGSVLQGVYERTGQRVLLDEAVAAAREALSLYPRDHPDRAALLGSLGSALGKLFARTGRIEVLEESVVADREAVATTPDGDPDRAMRLGNLGIALYTLFENVADIAVLEDAVRVLRESVGATPEGHPRRSGRLNNLAAALRALAEHTGDAGQRDEATRWYLAAADDANGDVYTRIKAYRQFAVTVTGPDAFSDPSAADAGQRSSEHAWSALAVAGPGASSASSASDAADAGLSALEHAADLAAVFAPRSLSRTDREHQLAMLSGLAGEAAAAALSAGRPERAVELLERVRGVLAAEAMGTKSSEILRLREHVPRLAAEFDEIRTRLDALPDPGLGHVFAAAGVTMPVQEKTDQSSAADRREVHAAWDGLIARIRKVSGFEGFLAAPDIAHLTRHVSGSPGPVVIVTTSPTRCDALVLTGTPEAPVQVVPLPGLTHADAVATRKSFLTALDHTSDPRSGPRDRVGAQREIIRVLAWLWDAIADPVLTHLGHVAAPAPGASAPRLWWCPVGPLALLPLHAAGHHDDDPDRPGGRRTALDRVLSSYTPTAQALEHARSRPVRAVSSSTLIVPAADAPDADFLPGVEGEITAIARLIADARLLPAPTRESVLRLLPGHRIAHFACHGHSDWLAPAESSLVLADHATTPLTVADITALDLAADLAFLSACDSSATAPHLADESIHITGAFHLAGYRNVIGTMWYVNDRISAELSAEFYAHLTDDGTTPPRAELSSRALNQATRRLRDTYPNSPSLWAGYTHTGP